MIIKVFKVSTKEMFTFKTKTDFMVFVYNIVDDMPPSNATINDLMKMLPKRDYYRVK